MFSKKDLQSGDVIKKRNGHIEIVVLPLGTLVVNDGGYNDLVGIREDLTSRNGTDFDIVAVRRPNDPVDCCFEAFEGHFGELVYERENKPLYSGKVVCIESRNTDVYTVGKIYKFKNGKFIDDKGNKRPDNYKIYTFEDWERYTNSKFIEIKE